MIRRELFSSNSIEAFTNHISIYQITGNSLCRLLAAISRASRESSTVERVVKQAHAQCMVTGIFNNGVVGEKILGMYAVHDALTYANRLFYQLQRGRAALWNWMIRGFVKMNRFDFALLFYFKMLGCAVRPDKYTFPPVIKACSGLGSVRLGRMVHDAASSCGFEKDLFVASSLMSLYVQTGCLNDAQELFDKMPERDSVLHNVMLTGFAKDGELDGAFKFLKHMICCGIKPNSATFSSILSLCGSETMILYGAQLHGLVVSHGLQYDPLLSNALVSMYSKCGNFSWARKLFSVVPETSPATWNGMISGYVQNGFSTEASLLFRDMVASGIKPDSITFSSFLPSITESASLAQGKQIHGYIIRHGMICDAFLKSALIDIYCKCMELEMANRTLEQNNMVDIVICTAMISGCVINGKNKDALEWFRWVVEQKMCPNVVTIASVLPACAGFGALRLGKELHGSIIKKGIGGSCHASSAVMDMYAKCARLDLAEEIFKRIRNKDDVCWNSMITNFSQGGKPEEAIDLFRQMRLEGEKYTCVAIIALISSCASMSSLCYGKQIHCFVIRGAILGDVGAECALMDMYAKCGSLKLAHNVFHKILEKNEATWNSIISAYGSHGCLKESISLYHSMIENGFHPDHITFLAIISACRHAGDVEQGIHYFRRMTQEHAVCPAMEHYACLVDLLARAGRLDEAHETIKSMPFSPDAGVWGTLLGACRVHHDIELADMASTHLCELDPENSGYYILMSNIHADAGQWGSVVKIRSLMREKGVQKIPGYSWIEVNGGHHVFGAADGRHS